MKEVFAIFGKRPIPGFAKTRLEKHLGSKKTQALYHSFMEEFFPRLESFDRDIHLFATPNGEETKRYFENLINSPFKFYFQSELPFFLRLKEVFEKMEGNFIHLTGTDIPDFPFEILNEVSPSLHRVYIGPDHDGGFYYLGAHSSHHEIFDLDIESGASNVLEKVIQKSKSLGLSVTLLKKWSDIDEIDDLNAYFQRKKLPPL
jgi:glycosyltransferase A (GT-A) superfamily protein (DUF2064 family)